jgi:hypothetical protein
VLFCADRSREVDEPLIGTATHAQTWFILEYAATWSAKATEDNDLPAPVQDRLNALLSGVAFSRAQFIRRARAAGGVRFYIAHTADTAQRLYRFDLPSHEALVDLDLGPVLAGLPAADPFLSSEPLYLVCVNGRRDPCCAKYGSALHRALATYAGDAVWQTTHVGGHRFAPTLLTLPDGVIYGRLTPDQAGDFVAATSRGLLTLDHMRGRSSYDSLVQAAEIMLRRESGELNIRAYRFLGVEEQAGGEHTIRFVEQATQRVHQIVLRRELQDLHVLASCGVPQLKPLEQFEFLRHETISSSGIPAG